MDRQLNVVANSPTMMIGSDPTAVATKIGADSNDAEKLAAVDRTPAVATRGLYTAPLSHVPHSHGVIRRARDEGVVG